MSISFLLEYWDKKALSRPVTYRSPASPEIHWTTRPKHNNHTAAAQRPNGRKPGDDHIEATNATTEKAVPIASIQPKTCAANTAFARPSLRQTNTTTTMTGTARNNIAGQVRARVRALRFAAAAIVCTPALHASIVKTIGGSHIEYTREATI